MSLRISVFISGSGTTLKNLIDHQQHHELNAEIVQVISSDPAAAGLPFAQQANIPAETVDYRKFQTQEDFSQTIFELVRSSSSQLIVLGGFLRKLVVPQDFENRIINIHPSLIPAFCGRGMYGRRVHQAVLDYGCKLTGCTVHFVDNQYDHGPIIAQHPVSVFDDDDVQTLAARVFAEECWLYPQVINAFAEGQVSVKERQVTISPTD